MRSFVAISWRADVEAARRHALERLARSSLQRRDPGYVVESQRGPSWLLLATDISPGPWRRLELVEGDSIGRPHRSPGGWLEIGSDRVMVTTDPIGLKHVYVASGEGWAAIASSALVLGALVGDGIEPDGWATLALLGHLPADQTLVRGVVPAARGHRIELTAGTWSASARSDAPPSEPVHGALAIRRAVQDQLAAAPGACLELSGGLDSRVVLAAIPTEERRGRRALTLGSAGDPDVRIATVIARREGLEHVIVDPGTAHGSFDEGAAAVLSSARSRDFASEPFAAALHDAVESVAPPGPRFTGVNGEYVRGFYYPGAFPPGRTTRRRVERLVRWRMLTNHRAEAPWFAPGWLDEAVERLIDRVLLDLSATGLEFRAATDEYYLYRRVAGWGGATYSHAATQREVLAPFLSPGFLSWVHTVPPSQRSGSRALAACLVDLDPGLASLELAGGVSPQMLVDTGIHAATRRARVQVTKVRRKIGQRMRHERRPSAHTDRILESVRRRWSEDDPAATIAVAPFIDDHELEKARPLASLDASTAAFVVNLRGALEFLDAAAEDGDAMDRPTRIR